MMTDTQDTIGLAARVFFAGLILAIILLLSWVTVWILVLQHIEWLRELTGLGPQPVYNSTTRIRNNKMSIAQQRALERYRHLVRSRCHTDDEAASFVFAAQLNASENPPVVIESTTPSIVWGNELDALDLKQLRHLGVTHILNCAGSRSCEFYSGEACFVYESLDLDDVATAILPLQQAERFFQRIASTKKQARVLVHCIEGRSRSGAIVAAFLMRRLHLDYDGTVAHMSKIARPPLPNAGFQEQLRRL